ncbi:hypothetical protein TrCOL_g7970 [Triparma columacea]|uniref:Uncharacterized protein n=1 Tax=Triparma columacea TaxID=722753 RepID=A0A9W7GA76_9STRA|nr:hypothetical protein TrCOL_g7970 [Triparma columacea]
MPQNSPLSQIYDLIDGKSFAKAIKLCTANPAPVTLTLKAYCLVKLQRYSESANLLLSTFTNPNNLVDIILDASILETAIITYHQIPSHITTPLTPKPGTDAFTSSLDSIISSPLLKGQLASKIDPADVAKFYQSCIRHILRVASTSKNPTPSLLTCAALATKISKVHGRWKFIAGVFYGLGRDGMNGMAGKMGMRFMEGGVEEGGEHEVFTYTELRGELGIEKEGVEEVLRKLEGIKEKSRMSEIHDEITVLENDGCLVKASGRDIRREIIKWARKMGGKARVPRLSMQVQRA